VQWSSSDALRAFEKRLHWRGICVGGPGDTQDALSGRNCLSETAKLGRMVTHCSGAGPESCRRNLRRFATGPTQTPLQTLLQQHGMNHVHWLNLEPLSVPAAYEALLGVDLSTTTVDLISVSTDVRQQDQIEGVGIKAFLLSSGFQELVDAELSFSGVIFHHPASIRLTLHSPMFGLSVAQGESVPVSFSVANAPPNLDFTWKVSVNDKPVVSGNSTVKAFFIGTQTLSLGAQHFRIVLQDGMHEGIGMFYVQGPAAANAADGVADDAELPNEIEQAFTRVYNEGIWLEGERRTSHPSQYPTLHGSHGCDNGLFAYSSFLSKAG
jgi:hypothetical protein